LGGYWGGYLGGFADWSADCVLGVPLSVYLVFTFRGLGLCLFLVILCSADIGEPLEHVKSGTKILYLEHI